MHSYTQTLTPQEVGRLRQALECRSFKFGQVPHALFAAQSAGVNVVCYASGKAVVQGEGTRDFVEFVLEPEVLLRAELGYEKVLNPELTLPRLGVDESGKGDLFGPLCVAAVYVNERIMDGWKDVGVRDSKSISSDKRVMELAERIRGTAGCGHTVVPIGNEAYNRLHGKLGSVNKILAWGHARCIENLLTGGFRLEPAPVRVIVDQFASTELTVSRALLTAGRSIEVVQRHKAEADIAVAAASILARAEFLARLSQLSLRYGVPLPKGAGSTADAALKVFVEYHGRAELGKVAKLHFRNTLEYK